MCKRMWDTYWHIIIYVYLTAYILYRHSDILFIVTWHVSTKFCIQFSESASVLVFPCRCTCIQARRPLHLAIFFNQEAAANITAWLEERRKVHEELHSWFSYEVQIMSNFSMWTWGHRRPRPFCVLWLDLVPLRWKFWVTNVGVQWTTFYRLYPIEKHFLLSQSCKNISLELLNSGMFKLDQSIPWQPASSAPILTRSSCKSFERPVAKTAWSKVARWILMSRRTWLQGVSLFGILFLIVFGYFGLSSYGWTWPFGWKFFDLASLCCQNSVPLCHRIHYTDVQHNQHKWQVC